MDDKLIYEGGIGGYTFLMKSEDRIEVWRDTTDEFPFSHIFVSNVRDKKDFDYEVMHWFSKNV